MITCAAAIQNTSVDVNGRRKFCKFVYIVYMGILAYGQRSARLVPSL